MRPSTGVSIAGGLFVGTAIALVPATLAYVGILSDCSAFDDAARCDTLHGRCVWNAATTTCAQRDVLSLAATGTCGNVTEKGDCVGACSWDAHNCKCVHLPPWSPAEVGYFAGANIVGGTAATALGSFLLRHVGIRGALFAAVAAAAIGVAVTTAAWAIGAHHGDLALSGGAYASFVVGHVIVGLGVGWTTVAAPQLANRLAAAETAEDIIPDALLPIAESPTEPIRHAPPSAVFAPAIAFGILATAVVAAACDPRVTFAAAVPFTYIVVNFMQLIGAALLAVAVVAARRVDGETLAVEVDADRERCRHDNEPREKATGALQFLQDDLDDSTAPCTADSAPKRILLGIALAVALQITGITAVMAFAPTLAAAAGVPPLLGNAAFMLWNAVSSLGARRAVRTFGERRLFLVGALVASIACLLTGFPTLATAHTSRDSGARIAADWCVLVGVVFVIAAYEICLAPAFYTLAQTIFPAHERRVGTSATVCAEFATTLLVNVGYAPLRSALSGDAGHGAADPAEHERIGQGGIFMLFGVAGLALTGGVYLAFAPAPSRDSRRNSDGAERVLPRVPSIAH